MHVVVTDGHLRVSLSVIRELQAAGHTVTAVCEAGRPPLGLHCRQAERRHLSPKGLSSVGYVEWLADVCAPLDRPILFPLGARTVAALSQHRAKIAPYARFLVPAPDVLARANDKPSVMRLAESLGIPTPQALTVQEGESIETFAARLPYPVVLKYRFGEGYALPAARRYKIVDNYWTFMRTYRSMSDIEPLPMVQTYIPGGGFGVSVLMNEEHRPVALFGHERIREYPVSGGPSTACRSAFYPRLNEMAVTLLTALSFTGWAMVEFKGSPEEPVLLEVNPRIWGSYPCATQAGAHLAQTYVRTVFWDEPPLDPLPRHATYTVGQVMQFFFNDAAAALQNLRRGRLDEVGRFIRDSFSPKVRGGVFSARDLPGSLYYLFHLRG